MYDNTDSGRAVCWVCKENGIDTLYPVSGMVRLGQGKYRCRRHIDKEIFDAFASYQARKKSEVGNLEEYLASQGIPYAGALAEVVTIINERVKEGKNG